MTRWTRPMRRAVALATAAALGAAALTASSGALAPPAHADPIAENFGNLLASGVNAQNVSAHLRAFQAIADRNDGNRALGTRGYTQSVEYVERQLREAGFSPTRQEFTTSVFEVESYSLRAGGTEIESEIVGFSGATEPVTAPVAALATGDETPGCEAEDFAAVPAGSIVVVDRGQCTFATKAENAKTAGAAAVVVVNNEPGDLQGTLGGETSDPLPVLGVAQEVGPQVRGAGSLTIAVDAATTTSKTWNVLAETVLGDPNSVQMVGAHLDGVPEGPGINDNGSGVAGVLQTAKALTAFAPVKNRVRFAFWGAEEQGLIGSTHYVETLPEAELSKIARYLNFDMIGSRNGGYFVYDGDGSADLPDAYPGPPGSGQIESVLESYLSGKGVGPESSGFNGRSDYDAFAQAGIPAGGVDSGADEKKSPEQAAKWGGTAGEIFDQNYHTEADTYANVNQRVLGVLAPAVAYATGYFAFA